MSLSLRSNQAWLEEFERVLNWLPRTKIDGIRGQFQHLDTYELLAAYEKWKREQHDRETG